MTRYRTNVALPDDIQEFLAPWFGQGEVTRIGEDFLAFEFEAGDLWDAAHVIKGVNDEAQVDKPTEVLPEAYVPTREGEWLSRNATPLYRIMKIAMNYADQSSDHALAGIIRTKRVELNDMFGGSLKDNPDVLKEG